MIVIAAPTGMSILMAFPSWGIAIKRISIKAKGTAAILGFFATKTTRRPPKRAGKIFLKAGAMIGDSNMGFN